MTMDLFSGPEDLGCRQSLAPGAMVLRRIAAADAAALLSAVDDVAARAPFRHMITPAGFRMSVAMTNCGSLGWVTDATGYRYDAVDPITGLNWPRMPDIFLRLAMRSAVEAGFSGFVPDACLINRYERRTRLSLHQDKDEHDYDQPIVSVSLGLPAVFLFGGFKRAQPPIRVPLMHGDVVVWGGPARLRYHGVMPLEDGLHPVVGPRRINLTFRKAA